MAAAPPPRRAARPSGWAVGGVIFAACVMSLVGSFQILAGLVALIDDQFYVVSRNYTYNIDTTGWGWIHLIIGILVLLTGLGLFARQSWAGVGAIFIVMLSALSNFLFIPYYPFWALLLIALDVWVIWALTRPAVLED